MQIGRFRGIIWGYYRAQGRKMPWRRTRDPYRILVSEIMLQQTQVARVLKFYPKFIKKFSNFRVLARARTADLLRAWQGMGYNRRALALREIAKIVFQKYHSRLPCERAALESLPGIGKATAGAIRAFAWNEPEVFIETNVRRVFIHFFFPDRARVTDRALARYIERTLSRKNPREWYWALMDYGAMLGANESHAGARDRKTANPNRKSAHYRTQPRFSGSDRELRGKILQCSLKKKKISFGALAKETNEPTARIQAIAQALKRERFINIRRRFVSIAR